MLKSIIKAIALLAWPRNIMAVCLQDRQRNGRGYPLPRGVVFHDLSPRMVIELGMPPAGHRYVRVAQDILLIAIGTGLVVDAVYDLNNM